MALPEDVREAPSLPAVGDILVGKYRIERLIGAGGMGMVVLAKHLQLETNVAIKFMLPNLRASAEARVRFLNEARAAASLKGDHVARILDYGTLETDAPFIVMEYLEGRDLAGILEERGMLEIDEAVEIVLQTCEAIAEAHELGIVHRDLKPENLFVTRKADGTPFVKVLDFGISKVMTEVSNSHRRTRSSALMGSLRYMSPEQMTDAAEVDTRTDIWALGVILFECLTGHPPFRSEGIPQLCAEVMHGQEPALRSLRPEVSESLESVVHHCLQKDRAARFATVSALAATLRTPRTEERNGPSFAPVALPSRPSLRAELDAETTAMEGELRHRSRWPVVFVAGALLGAAGAIGYVNHAYIREAGRRAIAETVAAAESSLSDAGAPSVDVTATTAATTTPSALPNASTTTTVAALPDAAARPGPLAGATPSSTAALSSASMVRPGSRSRPAAPPPRIATPRSEPIPAPHDTTPPRDEPPPPPPPPDDPASADERL